MLRRRSASVSLRLLAAYWFAFATLFGHSFHLHEHGAEELCAASAEYECVACEATSLAKSLAQHAPAEVHDDKCPACVYLSHSQLSAGRASTIAFARIILQRSPDLPTFLAQSVPHAFESRGPPLSLMPIAWLTAP
jgi:hypothetical protein